MAKKDRRILQQVQVVARLGRTLLAVKLLEKKLYAGQDQVMLALATTDGMTPSALAAEIGVRPPTVTKTIARLQAQGFVDKRGCETDARQTNIFLTEPGRALIAGIEKSIRKTEKQALTGLDKKEVKAFSKLLRKLETNLSKDIATADPVKEDDDSKDDDDGIS